MIQTSDKVVVGDDIKRTELLRDFYVQEKLYKAEIKVKKFSGEIYKKECYIKPQDLDSVKAVVEIIDFDKSYITSVDSDGKLVLHKKDMEDIFDG